MRLFIGVLFIIRWDHSWSAVVSGTKSTDLCGFLFLKSVNSEIRASIQAISNEVMDKLDAVDCLSKDAICSSC